MLGPRSQTTALNSAANPAALVWKELHDQARERLKANFPVAVTDMSGASFARDLEHSGKLQVMSHAKYQKLLRACAQALRAGYELGFAEIGGDVTRAYADLDLRGAVKVTASELEDVAMAMTEVLMECYPEHGARDDDPRARERAFRVVLLTAPSRHLGRDAGWKQGMHVVWPGVPVVREQLHLVRELWIKALERRFPRGGLKNYWADVVDAQVYSSGCGGLRFPHSSKYEVCRTCKGRNSAACDACRGAARLSVGRAYSVSEVLLPDGIRDTTELARLRGSLEAELLTCTIRTGLEPDSEGVARLEPPAGARPLEEVLRDAKRRGTGVATSLRRFAKWEGVDPDAPAYRAILAAARRTHPAFATVQLSRVAISPKQNELVAVSLDMRFCPNIQREHRSRIVFWVASLVRMKIVTRCTCECPGRCKDWPGDPHRLDGGELAAMFPAAADEAASSGLGTALTRSTPGWASAVSTATTGTRDATFWIDPVRGSPRPAAGQAKGKPRSKASRPRRGPGAASPPGNGSQILFHAMTVGRSMAQSLLYGRHPALVGHVPERWNAAAGITREASPTALSRASSVGSVSSAGSGSNHGAARRARTGPRGTVRAPVREPPFELAPDLAWATLGATRLELSPDQREALELVLSGNSVFITGPAGCGKSALVPIVLRAVRERFQLPPEAVAVTASTGIAAARLHLNARTVHSYFGLRKSGGARISPDSVEALSPALAMASRAYSTVERQRALRELRVLFVDEVSMLSADVLEAVSIVLRRAQTDPERAARPFGGVQVIFVGDFFQLPPVEGDRDREAVARALSEGRDPGPLRMRFAFQSPVWVAAVRYTINLATNFRQSSASTEWREALLRMRVGRLSDDDVRRLEGRMPSTSVPRMAEPGWRGTVLVGTNVAAEEHHRRALAELDGPTLTIHSTIGIATFDGSYSTAPNSPSSSSASSLGGRGAAACQLTNAADESRRLRARITSERGSRSRGDMRGPERELSRLCENVLAPDELVLRRGLNLMCLANLDTEGGLCNGTLLRVVDLELRRAAPEGGSGWHPIEGDTIVRPGSGAAMRMRQVAWSSSARDLSCEAILGVRVVAEYEHRGETKRVVVPLHCWSQRTRDRLAVAYMWQLPLRMSDAITVHKSQGMTLESVAVDLRGASQHGIGYTALSRARDWDGVTLLARFNPRRAFRAHPAVVRWAAALDPDAAQRLACRAPVFYADRGGLSAELATACRRMECHESRVRPHAADHMKHTVVTDPSDADEVWSAWCAFESAASTAVAPAAMAAKRGPPQTSSHMRTHSRARR